MTFCKFSSIGKWSDIVVAWVFPLRSSKTASEADPGGLDKCYKKTAAANLQESKAHLHIPGSSHILKQIKSEVLVDIDSTIDCHFSCPTP